MSESFKPNNEAGYCAKCKKGYAIGPHVCPADAERLASKEQVDEVLAFLGELLCDFVDRERTSKADLIGRAINLIVDARPAPPPPPALVTIARELDASFDKQTMPENVRLEYDAPDDHEYCVNITAKQLRALDRDVLATYAPTKPPPTVRWINFGSLNNGRCCWARAKDFAACRLPHGHDGEHIADDELQSALTKQPESPPEPAGSSDGR